MPHNAIEGVSFAEPQPGAPPGPDTYWYHYIDWPDGTHTPGKFDLRANVDDYLGRQDFRGKTVMEIGPASGFLTKEIAARGGCVTCVDTSDAEPWEAVPRRDVDTVAFHNQRVDAQRRLRAAWWWYTQTMFDTGARVAYCGVSGIAASAGKVRFDVAVLGAVLLHLRNPIVALYDVAELADMIVVTDEFVPAVEETGRAEAP